MRASLTYHLFTDQQRRDYRIPERGLSHMSHICVPVVDQEHTPLMPTTPARARRWIRSGKATHFRKGGVFCVRLNREPSLRAFQPKEAEKDSARMRRTRRNRKTPCRKPRQNRKQSKKKLPPSTRARGPRKLRLAALLCQLFPVSVFVVEDIKATTRGKKRWDQSFSPLEVGKHWFYAELSKLAPVQTKRGYETKALREQLGLKKTGKKLAEVWEAHCVDAWVLAHSAVGGRTSPDNRRVVCIAPLNWHHRQLHRFEPEKRGKRKLYGGTLSQGIKRGTLVKHPRWGKAYVGGSMDGQLSLHDLQTGKRLTQSAKVADCRPMKLVRWRTRLVPLFPTT